MAIRLICRMMMRKIMTSNNSPWSEINTPKQDYNVRKIPGASRIPLYWGKDNTGHCLFIVELTGDQSELFRRQHVNVQGIQSDLRLFDTTKTQGLVISLEKHVDQDIFLAMCQTLVSSLHKVSDPGVGLSVSLLQVKRWKAFMAGKKRGVLSSEEIRGLFGEITFLQQLLNRHYDEIEAVNAWQGPDGIHQDFIFNDIAVEVKALSGRERSSVRISSEDQFESLNDRLFLKVFRLVEMPDSDRALSLNDLVQKVETQLSNYDALEEFQDKLAKAGYVEINEYDSPEFIVREERTYLVEDDFPKLIRSELPDGVTKVRYEIELETIREFIVENGSIWEV